MKIIKEYSLPIGMIAIGAGLIALVWKVEIKWVAFPVFIIGALFIILGLTFAGNIAEFNEKQKHPEYDAPIGETNLFERIVHYGGYVSAVSVFILFHLAERKFDNYISGTEFFLKSAGVGIAAAVLFYNALKKIYPTFIRYNKERQSSLFAYCMTIVAWSIFGITLINESGASSRVEKVLVLEKSKNISYGTPFLFLQINGKRERFVPKKKEWKEIEEGDSVFLNILNGKFGYDLVTGFYPGNSAPHIRQPQTTR